MIKTTFTIGRHVITVLTPAFCTGYPIVYTHLSAEVAEAVASLLEDVKVALVAIDHVDWNAELSPWPAPRAFRGEIDFAGGAATYLTDLMLQIIPKVENFIGYTPACRAIAGYSMAGLFAVYALYHTDQFSRAASISGSLWYDDFINSMKDSLPLRMPERVYFSLGNRESEVRDKRLARVESCTSEAEKLIQSLGSKTLFEINQGNHFTEVPERIAKGIRWLVEE